MGNTRREASSMTNRFQALRTSLAVVALVVAVAASGPAPAQHGQDRNPITQPNSTNPTANSVREEDLLNRLQKLEGRRSEEHTSELQSRQYLVCRLLLEKKKTNKH